MQSLAGSSSSRSVRLPAANAFCERLIGTIRRECLDWQIPLHEAHLRASSSSGLRIAIGAVRTRALAPAFRSARSCAVSCPAIGFATATKSSLVRFSAVFITSTVSNDGLREHGRTGGATICGLQLGLGSLIAIAAASVSPTRLEARFPFGTRFRAWAERPSLLDQDGATGSPQSPAENR